MRKRRKNNGIIQMRVSRADLEKIDQAAAILGKTRSAFIRQCAETAAWRTLNIAYSRGR
jgi:uncharacterized protein (DUF1778 family)